MSPFHYNTIEQTAMAEFKDRGSRFIAYAYPAQSIDQCKKLVAQLKKEHPKAVHHCFAYRLGVDGVTFKSVMIVNRLGRRGVQFWVKWIAKS
jgi:putative IMPACT (imprinted ancient) family translation regulator